MAIGDFGLPGHLVEVIVRSQDPEAVTILLQQMEETLVLILVKIKHPVLEVSVHQEMVPGDFGHLGHLVEMIVKNQDPEVVPIQPQQMEETLVLVLVKIQHHVLEVSVHQEMVPGEVGDLGHLVEVIARNQDPEAVTIHPHKMEGTLVLVLVKIQHPVLEVSVHQ